MEKVDVIIVGGGLAGLSCAYELADSGMTILVLERGDFSGSKNVTGGRLYLAPLRGYLPDLWKDAPFERRVTKELLTLVGDTHSATLELQSSPSHQQVSPSYPFFEPSSIDGLPISSPKKGYSSFPRNRWTISSRKGIR
jgi:electron transfer flavoprotein-quinone oxidoreductase